MSDEPELLTPEAEKGLALFAVSDHDVADVRWTLIKGYKRINRLTGPTIPLAILGGGAAVFGWTAFYVSHKAHSHLPAFIVSNAVPLIIGGSALYVLCIIWTFALRRMSTIAQFRALRAIFAALDLLGPALHTPLASWERRALARQLLECAKRVVDIRPLTAHKLDNKIITQQAISASEVLQQLVFPSLLGSDEELESIGSTLWKAALKLGTPKEMSTSNWVRIGELTAEVKQYQIVKTGWRIRWSSQLNGIGLAVLTAIPAIPVLIGYLG
jgi:hypothetical protein